MLSKTQTGVGQPHHHIRDAFSLEEQSRVHDICIVLAGLLASIYPGNLDSARYALFHCVGLLWSIKLAQEEGFNLQFSTGNSTLGLSVNFP